MEACDCRDVREYALSGFFLYSLEEGFSPARLNKFTKMFPRFLVSNELISRLQEGVGHISNRETVLPTLAANDKYSIDASALRVPANNVDVARDRISSRAKIRMVDARFEFDVRAREVALRLQPVFYQLLKYVFLHSELLSARLQDRERLAPFAIEIKQDAFARIGFVQRLAE